MEKPAPPPDEDQARQDEDDRSERPRGAGDRLDDIVLEDVRPAKMPQHRDRYYRRRIAWRVLDAQYFGVAQRRKRVVLVASGRSEEHKSELQSLMRISYAVF